MSEPRGLLARVKNRINRLRGQPAAAAGIGPGFHPDYEEEWNELVEQVDNYTQKVGAAVVQTWEVGAAELGRAVHGHAQDKQLIERFSDSLVPYLTPFQDLHKHAKSAMTQGFAAGTRQGSMAAATAPLAQMVDGLGDRAVEGWEKTAEYLAPVFALTADPPASRAKFHATSARVRRACDDAQAVLRKELEALPSRPKLWSGVCDSFDAWQLRLTRELEICMTEAERQLVADVRAGLGK